MYLFLILIIFSVFSYINLSQISDLRFLQKTIPINSDNSNITATATVAPIFVLPKCKNDIDCSYNGYCEMSTKICICNTGFDTYFEPQKLQDLYDSRSPIIIKSNITSNVTINYNIIFFTNDEIKYCNYLKKKQLTALLLSIFVGFGVEHFYLGRYKVAAAKIVFYTFCCALNIFYFIMFKCCNKKKYVEHLGVFEVFYLSCGFIYMVLWNVYDWVNIGFNTYLDGNGLQMLNWNNTAS